MKYVSGQLSSLQKAFQKQNKVNIFILDLDSCLRSFKKKGTVCISMIIQIISANGCKTLGTFFLTHNYGNYENVEALR